MNNKTLFFIAISLFAFGIILPSCSPQHKIAGNYNSFETECLGVELDGSQTLKSWGFGRNRTDAVEQAKKNAIRDVLFKGIRNGRQDCNLKPLLNEPNAQERHENFFNKFFADGGEYSKFISMKDQSTGPQITKDRKGAGSEVTYGVIVRVLRSELRSEMIKDNILKKD